MPFLTNHRFKEAFRVTRKTFQFLVERLHFLRREDTIFRNAIVLEKRIGIALYALASSAEYRTIAVLFGVGRTTVGELVIEFCKAILMLLKSSKRNSSTHTLQRSKNSLNSNWLQGSPWIPSDIWCSW